MKLSIIIPVFNEAGLLPKFVPYLVSAFCPIEREFIFIDDCSTDESRTILQKLQDQYAFTLIQQQRNMGKGAAIVKGIESATGDYLLIQDADFEYDPHDIPKLLDPILLGQADVVFGSRFKKSASQVHRTFHYFVNRGLTGLSNICSGIYLTDMETCYKLFRTELVKAMRLKSKRFGIEVEFTAYVAKTSARVHEVAINYYPRTRLQGKKISWKDGLAALFHLLRFNFFTPISAAFSHLPSQYRNDSRAPTQLEWANP